MRSSRIRSANQTQREPDNEDLEPSTSSRQVSSYYLEKRDARRDAEKGKSKQILPADSSDEETPIIIPKAPDDILKNLSNQRNGCVAPVNFQRQRT